MAPTMLTSAEAVEEAFYDAMRRGDLQAMMALWSDDDEVICIHPGGPRLVGLDAVRASWDSILSSGAVAISVAQTKTIGGAVLCVHNVIERISVQAQRGPQTIQCVATNVYVKGPRGWRMLLHHAAQAEDSGDAQPQVSVPSGAVLH
jgi:ketosteroid isomerase-like protein